MVTAQDKCSLLQTLPNVQHGKWGQTFKKTFTSKEHRNIVTAFSQIVAAASISFSFVKVGLLFRHGLYSRAAFIHFSVIAVHL